MDKDGSRNEFEKKVCQWMRAPGASGEPPERLTICGGVQGDQINSTDIPKTGWVTTRVTAITGNRTIGRNVPG